MTGTSYLNSSLTGDNITVGDIRYVAVTLRDIKCPTEFYVPVEIINIITHTGTVKFEVHFLSGDSTIFIVHNDNLFQKRTIHT
jgi:hypothetical protein